MTTTSRTFSGLLLAGLLMWATPSITGAKGYSSGGGRSYSSSRSSSSSSNRSWSSGASHSSSSGRKSFESSNGRSYSSGSRSSDDNRHGYGSGKSYTSGTGHLFASHASQDEGAVPPRARESARRAAPDSTGFSFDGSAARASKQQASQREFKRFKDAQAATAPSSDAAAHARSAGDASPAAFPGGLPRRDQPPLKSPWRSGSYRSASYFPDREVLISRPVRVHTFFEPYYSRPVVIYRDSYSSFFWWWLLDRSIEDRAWWAYHHRYDMDPARYQALVASDQQLEARVQQLETQQAQRDPGFVPAGLDRDLMYSDQYVSRAYNNRPTLMGRILFFVFGVPAAVALCCFFIWLIWFKRW